MIFTILSPWFIYPNGAEWTSDPSQCSPRRLGRLAAPSAVVLIAQGSLSPRASVAVNSVARGGCKSQPLGIESHGVNDFFFALSFAHA